MLLMKVVENLQNLDLALPIQTVAAFCFDSRGAVRCELAKIFQSSSFQDFCGGAAQMFHCRTNSAARASDLFVSCAGNALFVLRGAAKRKNQVSVRIDKSGQNNTPAKLQLFRASRFRHTFDAPLRADRRDAILIHQNRAVANDFNLPECASAPWHRPAHRQNLRAPGNQPVRHGCDDTASLRGKHYSNESPTTRREPVACQNGFCRGAACYARQRCLAQTWHAKRDVRSRTSTTNRS